MKILADYLGEPRLMILGAKDPFGDEIYDKWVILDRRTGKNLTPPSRNVAALEECLHNLIDLITE